MKETKSAINIGQLAISIQAWLKHRDHSTEREWQIPAIVTVIN
jgi:hypothetical protein